jgi:hypothetical protein
MVDGKHNSFPCCGVRTTNLELLFAFRYVAIPKYVILLALVGVEMLRGGTRIAVVSEYDV